MIKDNSNKSIKKIKLNDNLQNKSPFSHTKYNFIIPNSVDLRDNFIQFGEISIDRAKSQTILSDLIMDINIAIKMELSIFEYALIYCANKKYEPNYIKPIYLDKLNEIVSNLDENKDGIKNKTFKSNILSGKINPANVAFLSPSQIHPEKWSDIIKKENT